MSKGTKNDADKLRFDLLPYDALEQVARVMAAGAAKYGERNWEEGMAYSRLFAASQRHLVRWFQHGEDLDPESGLSHLAHAACSILYLLAYVQRERKHLDNRPYTAITSNPLPAADLVAECHLFPPTSQPTENDDEFPGVPRY